MSGARRSFRIATVLFFVLCVTAERVTAQLTSKDLVGSIVAKYDEKKYAGIDQAIAAIKAGNLDGARAQLVAAAKADKDLPPAGVMLARILLVYDNLPLAKNELERAVMDAPADPEAYLLFSQIAIAERRVTDADLLLREGQRRAAEFKGNPQRAQTFPNAIHPGLASVCEARGQWKEAQGHLNECIKLDEKNAAAHQRLGQALFHMKKLNEARAELEAARKLDKNLPIVEITLAGLYAADGDTTAATKLVEDGVKQSPKDSATLVAAANWAYSTSDFERAKTYAESALQAKKSIEALLLCGLVARQLGDNATAEQRFEEAYLQSPSNTMAANALALILAQSKDVSRQQRALDFAKTNMEKNPRDPNCAVTLAWVAYKRGLVQDALRALQGALSAGQITPESAYLAALILEDQGNAGLAKGILEKAIYAGTPFPDRDKAEKLLSRIRQGRPAGESTEADSK